MKEEEGEEALVHIGNFWQEGLQAFPSTCFLLGHLELPSTVYATSISSNHSSSTVIFGQG